MSHIQGGNGFSLPGFVSRIFSVRRFLEALVVTVIGGFYLASQPELYRKGRHFCRPAAVIAFIAIEKLCVRDSLGEATVLPGEPQRRGQRMAG